MIAPTPTQWNIFRNGSVHSTWPSGREARLHASYLNSMIYDDEYEMEEA
jgi:hypothetical protein